MEVIPISPGPISPGPLVSIDVKEVLIKSIQPPPPKKQRKSSKKGKK